MGIGGIIGGVIAGISHALSNPCQNLRDMLASGDFWRDVGIGFVSGALAGLVGFAMPHLLPLIGINIQASLGVAIIGGAITGGLASGTGQVVTNLLTGQEWHSGLGRAILTGAFTGGIAGGIGYKVREFLSAKATGTAINNGVKAPAFPKELAGGGADTHVHLGISKGRPVYAGITNDVARRQAQHGARFILQRITQSLVTRGQARAIEQALIVRNPHFENIINSISPKLSWYNLAVEWGEWWLQHHGF